MAAISKPGKKRKARVLIVDDHPITREGLSSLIRQTADLTVCGEAPDAEHSIGVVRSTKPDVILVDISLPGRSGIELIKDLRALNPSIPILVISMHEESLYAERALRAGARGYLRKEADGGDLLDAIRQVLAGKIFVSREASLALLENFSADAGPRSRSSVHKLSDREFEVFTLLGEGLATAQIGERLHVSAKTVETHRANIKARLGIKTATQLVAFAARWCSDGSPAGR